MAAPFHRILSKTDRALVAFITSVVTGVSGLDEMVWPARRSLNKSVPGIVAHSEEWTPHPGDEGAAMVKASITVKTKTSLEPGEAEHSARLSSENLSAKIFDAFYLSESGLNGFSTLADAITDAARDLSGDDPDNNADLEDFKCDYVRVTGGSLTIDEDSNFWMDTLELELHCRASSVNE